MMRASAPFLVGLLAALAACSSGPQKLSPEQEFELYSERASGYYQAGDVARAEDQAQRALSVKRRDVPMRLMLGWIALQRGDTQNLLLAEQIFREVLEDSEESAQGQLGLAESLERLGVVDSQTADGIASGERLPQRGTKEARAEELRESARRRWKEAVRHFEGALGERERSLKALNGLQRTHTLLGQYEDALAYAERVIEAARAESEDFRLLMERAKLPPQREVELRQSEFRARRLRGDTHMLASDLLVRLERPESALAHLDQALELDPTRVDALGRRAELRYARGDAVGAITDIDLLLAQATDLAYEHPDIRRAYDLRAKCETLRAQQPKP